MRFLICGLGSIGQRHYRNLRQLGHDDIQVFRTGKGANQSFIQKFELEFQPTIHRNIKTALALRPDVVIITNPTSLHVQYALMAVKAGAHVFIEKPISHNERNLSKLIAEAKKRGLIVYVGYHLRFHPLLQKVHSWVHDKRIDTILSARVEMGEYLPGWHPWENYKKSYASRADLGGGVILTQSHDLDYLFWLFGKAHRVSSFGGQKNTLKISAEDLAEILIEFRSGVVASVHMDYLQYPAKRVLEIIGTKGSILWNMAEKSVELRMFSPSKKTTVHMEPKDFERNDMFIAEMRHFIRATCGKEPALVDAEAGRESLRIAIAAKTSMKKHATVKI